MAMTEIPAPGPGAGINSQMEFNRATPVVLRNSRILIGVTMFGSIVAVFFALCMVLMVFSVFGTGGLSGSNALSAAQWGFGALAFGYMCPWLCRMARSMASYRVYFDGRGVNFSLGTKKKPSELFMAWDQISAIKRKRIGNAQTYWVEGTDGSEARFSSYTFFRPKKVARMIAERAGLAIQKA